MVVRAAILYHLLYLDVSNEVQWSVPYLAIRKHTPTYREAGRLLLRILGRGYVAIQSLVMCPGQQLYPKVAHCGDTFTHNYDC